LPVCSLTTNIVAKDVSSSAVYASIYLKMTFHKIARSFLSRRTRERNQPNTVSPSAVARSVPAGIKSSQLPHPFLFPHQKSTGAQPRLLASSTAFSCQSPTGGVGPANNSPVRKLISRWVVFSDGDGISVSILGSTYLLAARHSCEPRFLRCAALRPAARDFQFFHIE
jgi:hypothetical protein